MNSESETFIQAAEFSLPWITQVQNFSFFLSVSSGNLHLASRQEMPRQSLLQAEMCLDAATPYVTLTLHSPLPATANYLNAKAEPPHFSLIQLLCPGDPARKISMDQHAPMCHLLDWERWVQTGYMLIC